MNNTELKFTAADGIVVEVRRDRRAESLGLVLAAPECWVTANLTKKQAFKIAEEMMAYAGNPYDE